MLPTDGIGSNRSRAGALPEIEEADCPDEPDGDNRSWDLSGLTEWLELHESGLWDMPGWCMTRNRVRRAG
jgi:hypothetical protein